MSFQGYLDTIRARTGRTPEELVALARRKGLLEPGVKPAQIIAWLKDDFDLGRGHAMAIVAVIERHTKPQAGAEEKVARHFGGKKAHWRPVYDALVERVNAFGGEIDVLAGAGYLSLRRAGRKFAIVRVTADRLDVGIKLKGVPAAGRLEQAGSWNTMVTHRVRVHDPAEVDRQLLGWLEQAFEAAG